MMVFQRHHQGNLMILMTKMMRTRRIQSQIMSLWMMLEIVNLNIEMEGQSMRNQNQQQNLNRCQNPSHNQEKISQQNIPSQSLNLSQMIIKTKNLEKIGFDSSKMS